MNKLTILIDTREKNYYHIKNWLTKNGYLFKRKKLDFGDYSFEFDGRSYESRFVVERKSGNKLRGGGFNELKGNIMGFHKVADQKKYEPNIIRFKREFDKAVLVKAEFGLLLENANGIDDIMNCDCHLSGIRKYLSNEHYKYNFIDFIGKRQMEREVSGLASIQMFYVDEENTAELMVGLFENYLNG